MESAPAKQLGNREKLEKDIDFTNKEYTGDESFQDITNLAAKLAKLKGLFLKHSCSRSGEIDYIAFHAIARELGVFTTLAELKQRVQEITGNARNVLCYKDCAMAMLGRRSTICQRIMMYNGNDVFQKQICWLDYPPAYLHYLECTLPSNLHSPITLLPPPPPPSPADLGPRDDFESYPAA